MGRRATGSSVVLPHDVVDGRPQLPRGEAGLMPASHVNHEVLADHAQNKVNIPAEEAAKRRGQINYLRARLEAHIAAHPGYALVKLRASGSTAKHTAIRRRRGEGSDADVAAYVPAISGGGIDAQDGALLA